MPRIKKSRGGVWSTKEYKGRTDSNSPTETNEAIYLAVIIST